MNQPMTEAIASSDGLLKLVNQTVELPTIPEVLRKLNHVVADPDSTVDDVAAVIATDPSVVTNILRLVNSAYYGLQVRVSSLNGAISMMGFNMTKKVALKAAVFSVFANNRIVQGASFDAKVFWQHSIFTGIAARTLGAVTEAFRQTEGEDLYICGLLHDIGKIILTESLGRGYMDILDQAQRTGLPLHEAEAQLLGFNHAEVGSVLAIKWFLPEDLAVAIRYHHSPDRDPFRPELSSLVHLADSLAWNANFPSVSLHRTPELQPEVYDTLGLDPADVEELLPQIIEDFQSTELPF